MARRNSYEHTVTAGFTPVSIPVLDVPTDALSAPSNDDLISSGISFWPTGAAWGSPDGEAVSLRSVFARFTRVLLSPFEWLYARSWRLALESSAQTLSETLDGWEADYGLPERCFLGEQSATQRLTALRRKVNATPISVPEDFVRLASDLGFEIEIEEPCIFECGFSECGSYHPVGSPTEETYWIVRVKGASISYFEIGTSQAGEDRLFALGEAEQILCLLRQHAPGWALPILQPWIYLDYLTTEDGTPIIDEYGNQILVTIDP
ncbi:putative phage tail protein [Shinella zoogloeoides]|uniref:putative phage tail protein n=1 Tax=Shinella zoogloeoides TaxID=352475 RepID=UPI001F589519|nr:putative phage tail protein [Shinella zoogloeoides]